VPQVGAVAYERGDTFVICSYGLVDGLYDHQIVELLRSPQARRKGANPARLLVAAAVENSGRDNTTAMVIRVH
jgi:protein phosphatase